MAGYTKVEPMTHRAMSSFALSIGTALAFESLFKGDRPAYDPTRVVPQQLNILDYEQIWINLATLVRNIHSSVPSAEANSLMAVDIFMTLEQEFDTLRQLIDENSQGRCRAIFYVTDDSKLPDKHRHAKFRKDTTDRQLAQAAVRQAVIDEFLKRHSHIPGLMTYYEQLMPPSRVKALILTHDAYDLLSRPNFSDLHLLESHTGLLKKHTQWYTKYSEGKTLMRIPFNSTFMQIFGDSVHFHPFPFKDRALIRQMADERNWTTLTTTERVKFCFEDIKEPLLKSVLLDMLSE